MLNPATGARAAYRIADGAVLEWVVGEHAELGDGAVFGPVGVELFEVSENVHPHGLRHCRYNPPDEHPLPPAGPAT